MRNVPYRLSEQRRQTPTGSDYDWLIIVSVCETGLDS